MTQQSTREQLFVFLCNVQLVISVIFVFSVIGLLFTVYSLLQFEQGDGPVVIAILNVPGLVFMISWTGYVLWKCHHARQVS